MCVCLCVGGVDVYVCVCVCVCGWVDVYLAAGKAAREVESAVKRQRKHVRQHVSGQLLCVE